MRTQINYLFSISFVLLCCFSCSQEDITVSEEPKEIQLQLGISEEATLSDLESELLTATIVSTSPLVIQSEHLEVGQALLFDTNEIVPIIALKRTEEFNPEGNGDPCEPSERFAYQFDPVSLCFLFGMEFTNKDCTKEFVWMDTTNPCRDVCLVDLVKALP